MNRNIFIKFYKKQEQRITSLIRNKKDFRVLRQVSEKNQKNH